MGDLVRAMGMEGISRSQVPRLCTEIHKRVRDFLARPIEGDRPYPWLDATYVKVREAGRIVPVAVTIAVGVNADGRREVLGMAVGSSEAEPFWLDFPRTLKRRGPAARQHHVCLRPADPVGVADQQDGWSPVRANTPMPSNMACPHSLSATTGCNMMCAEQRRQEARACKDSPPPGRLAVPKRVEQRAGSRPDPMSGQRVAACPATRLSLPGWRFVATPPSARTPPPHS